MQGAQVQSLAWNSDPTHCTTWPNKKIKLKKEKEMLGCTLGVLTQEHPTHQNPTAYCSLFLRLVAKDNPPCLRAILPSAKLTKEIPWWLRWWRVCLQYGRPEFHPWIGKIPWRRKWQPAPVFLPGESHGRRSLGGYSSWSVGLNWVTSLSFFLSFKLNKVRQILY